jgi:hypothetical protein
MFSMPLTPTTALIADRVAPGSDLVKKLALFSANEQNERVKDLLI